MSIFSLMIRAFARMLRVMSHVLPKIRRLNAFDVNVTYAHAHSRTTYVNDVKFNGCSDVHTLTLAAPHIAGVMLRQT